MRIILKSFLYSFYFIKSSWKEYAPLALYLFISQFLIMLIQNIFFVLLFFVGYLVISAPLVINIFRNIILDETVGNSYLSCISKSYTKIFINRTFYLLFSVIGIYILHVIVLSPFFPENISSLTIYLYILFIYMIYIYSRILFILPAAACGIKKNLKDSYVLTKNRSLKTYFLYISIIIPYLLINMSISYYSEILEIKEFFLFLAIFLQIFFTIISTSLVGYIYKGFKGK
ncbi:MAG: hypothetical protein P8L38_04525 [Gammaproteobacteria bacterium]|jgi:hypothetical protein|nr:hypothetical protein [Gammaproteobacteria bacterium]